MDASSRREARRADRTRRLVILGNGMAGHRLCQRIAETRDGVPLRIVVFAEEPRPAYDRVHLSDVLAKRPFEELLLAPTSWYEEQGIELRLGDPALRLDLASRVVEGRSGERVEFDDLVFATGSAATVPPLPGAELPGVLLYRHATDVSNIARAAAAARARSGRVAIVGGGLLGVELAYALRGIGCEVRIFERATHLLHRQLDAPASAALESRIRSLEIGLELGRRLEAFLATPPGVGLRFADGEREDFEFVVVAAGVRPRDELAREAGLRVHPRGGILVDDRLESSVPGVYAVGECARHRNVQYGLASPCLAMADVVAHNLVAAYAKGRSGATRRFRRVAPATRLKVDDVDVSMAGNAVIDGYGIHRVTYGEGSVHRSIVLREGRMVGAVAVGEWPEWHRIQEAISRTRMVLPWERRRLEKDGRLWGERGGRPISRWADATTVCTCMGVDCGALRRALAEGCGSATQLAERTGASTVCGTCRPLLEALAGERPEAARASAGAALLPAGALAALLVAVVVSAPPVGLSDSVQHASLLERAADVLWRDGLARQITGFVTLGVCVASLVFSLRKRWRRLARFSYPRWRSFHAILGAAGVAGLALHTGFRMGSNLDRALAASFVCLAALGALAGVVTATERRLSPAAGARLRRWASFAHAYAFWPFLVLVSFHVLKVYWY